MIISLSFFQKYIKYLDFFSFKKKQNSPPTDAEAILIFRSLQLFHSTIPKSIIRKRFEYLNDVLLNIFRYLIKSPIPMRRERSVKHSFYFNPYRFFISCKE